MEYTIFRRDYKEGEGIIIRGRYSPVQIRIVKISNLENGRGATLEIFRSLDEIPQKYEIKDFQEHELDYEIFVRIERKNTARGRSVRLKCRIPEDYNLKVIPRRILRQNEQN